MKKSKKCTRCDCHAHDSLDPLGCSILNCIDDDTECHWYKPDDEYHNGLAQYPMRRRDRFDFIPPPLQLPPPRSLGDWGRDWEATRRSILVLGRRQARQGGK